MKAKEQKPLSKQMILIAGESGMGKTGMFATLPTSDIAMKHVSRALFVTTENKETTLKDFTFDKRSVGSWLDLNKVMIEIMADKGEKWDYIYIDSFTRIGDTLKVQLELEKIDGFKFWGHYGDRLRKVLRELNRLPQHVIVTALLKENKTGETVINIQGNDMPPELPSWFSEVFYCKIISTETGDKQVLQTHATGDTAAKDESGTLDMYEIPYLKHIFNKMSTKESNMLSIFNQYEKEGQ